MNATCPVCKRWKNYFNVSQKLNGLKIRLHLLKSCPVHHYVTNLSAVTTTVKPHFLTFWAFGGSRNKLQTHVTATYKLTGKQTVSPVRVYMIKSSIHSFELWRGTS